VLARVGRAARGIGVGAPQVVSTDVLDLHVRQRGVDVDGVALRAGRVLAVEQNALDVDGARRTMDTQSHVAAVFGVVILRR
jgi:hypothetical protein